MRNRSWRWLRMKILGLLDRPGTVIPIGSPQTGYRTIPVYPNRLQAALAPPPETDDVEQITR